MERERERNGELPTQRLISSERNAQSPNETSTSNNASVEILQPNRPVYEQLRNVQLSNVMQSGENVLQPAPANDGNKINRKLSYIQFFLFLSSFLVVFKFVVRDNF